MRGLKRVVQNLVVVLHASHLLQMRGLKPLENQKDKEPGNVASFTDAWIETLMNTHIRPALGSRIFYRCVD